MRPPSCPALAFQVYFTAYAISGNPQNSQITAGARHLQATQVVEPENSRLARVSGVDSLSTQHSKHLLSQLRLAISALHMDHIMPKVDIAARCLFLGTMSPQVMHKTRSYAGPEQHQQQQEGGGSGSPSGNPLLWASAFPPAPLSSMPRSSTCGDWPHSYPRTTASKASTVNDGNSRWSGAGGHVPGGLPEPGFLSCSSEDDCAAGMEGSLRRSISARVELGENSRPPPVRESSAVQGGGVLRGEQGGGGAGMEPTVHRSSLDFSGMLGGFQGADDFGGYMITESEGEHVNKGLAAPGTGEVY